MATDDAETPVRPTRWTAVRETVQRALRLSQWLRRSLVIFTGAILPGALAYIQAWGAGGAERALASQVGTGVVVIVAVVLAIALAATEEDLRPLVRQVDSLSDQLRALHDQRAEERNRNKELEGEIDELRKRGAARSEYWKNIYVAKQEITAITPWEYLLDAGFDDENIVALVHELLEIIISKRNILFEFGEQERWSMSVYVRNDDTLYCLAYRGDATKDDGQGHREWPLGVGHVGVASLQKWRIVIDDASKEEWFKLFRDTRADQDKLNLDRELYKSLAVIPFHLSPSNIEKPSDGVICATSNQVGRFTEANIAPLIDLALGVTEVLRTLDDGDDDGEAGDGGDEDSAPLEERPEKGQ